MMNIHFHRRLLTETSIREQRMLGMTVNPGHERPPAEPPEPRQEMQEQMQPLSPEEMQMMAYEEKSLRRADAMADKEMRREAYKEFVEHLLDQHVSAPGAKRDTMIEEMRKISREFLIPRGFSAGLTDGVVVIHDAPKPLSANQNAKNAELNRLAGQIRQIDLEIRGLANAMMVEGRKVLGARYAANVVKNPSAMVLQQMASLGVNMMSPQLMQLQTMRMQLIGTYNAVKYGRQPVMQATPQMMGFPGAPMHSPRAQMNNSGPGVEFGNLERREQIIDPAEIMGRKLDAIMLMFEENKDEPHFRELEKKFKAIVDICKGAGVDFTDGLTMLFNKDGKLDVSGFEKKIGTMIKDPTVLGKLEEALKAITPDEAKLLGEMMQRATEIVLKDINLQKAATGEGSYSLEQASEEEKASILPLLEALKRTAPGSKEHMMAEARLMMAGVDTATIGDNPREVRILPPNSLERMISTWLGLFQLISAVTGKKQERPDIRQREEDLDKKGVKELKDNELDQQIQTNERRKSEFTTKEADAKKVLGEKEKAFKEANEKTDPRTATDVLIKLQRELDEAQQAVDHLKKEREDVQKRLDTLKARKEELKNAPKAPDVVDVTKAKEEVGSLLKEVFKKPDAEKLMAVDLDSDGKGYKVGFSSADLEIALNELGRAKKYDVVSTPIDPKWKVEKNRILDALNLLFPEDTTTKARRTILSVKHGSDFDAFKTTLTNALAMNDADVEKKELMPGVVAEGKVVTVSRDYFSAPQGISGPKDLTFGQGIAPPYRIDGTRVVCEVENGGKKEVRVVFEFGDDDIYQPTLYKTKEDYTNNKDKPRAFARASLEVRNDLAIAEEAVKKDPKNLLYSPEGSKNKKLVLLAAQSQKGEGKHWYRIENGVSEEMMLDAGISAALLDDPQTSDTNLRKIVAKYPDLLINQIKKSGACVRELEKRPEFTKLLQENIDVRKALAEFMPEFCLTAIEGLVDPQRVKLVDEDFVKLVARNIPPSALIKFVNEVSPVSKKIYSVMADLHDKGDPAAMLSLIQNSDSAEVVGQLLSRFSEAWESEKVVLSAIKKYPELAKKWDIQNFYGKTLDSYRKKRNFRKEVPAASIADFAEPKSEFSKNPKDLKDLPALVTDEGTYKMTEGVVLRKEKIGNFIILDEDRWVTSEGRLSLLSSGAIQTKKVGDALVLSDALGIDELCVISIDANGKLKVKRTKQSITASFDPEKK